MVVAFIFLPVPKVIISASAFWIEFNRSALFVASPSVIFNDFPPSIPI